MRALRELRPAALTLAPWVLALAVAAAGVMLLFSGATPSDPMRFLWLARYTPLILIEISHFLSSIIGLVLVLLAFGLTRRLDAAWIAAMLLLPVAAALALTKGFDWEESAILAAVFLALGAVPRGLPARRAADPDGDHPRLDGLGRRRRWPARRSSAGGRSRTSTTAQQDLPGRRSSTRTPTRPARCARRPPRRCCCWRSGSGGWWRRRRRRRWSARTIRSSCGCARSWPRPSGRAGLQPGAAGRQALPVLRVRPLVPDVRRARPLVDRDGPAGRAARRARGAVLALPRTGRRPRRAAGLLRARPRRPARPGRPRLLDPEDRRERRRAAGQLLAGGPPARQPAPQLAQDRRGGRDLRGAVAGARCARRWTS